jgi:hypothetical protein
VTLVARITFLVLVGATFGAFFVAQRLKSSAPVVQMPGLARYFAPACDCRRAVNRFSVIPKVSDDVTVDVVTLADDPVKRLADAVHVDAHRALRLAWDGSRDGGGRAPDGQYRIRVSLRSEGRAVIVPQTTTLDTKPPQPVVCVGSPCSKKPAGNVVGPVPESVKVYVKGVSRFPTRFTVLRTDGGKPRPVTTFMAKGGRHEKTWDGQIDGAPAPAGIYLIRAQVRDTAGNVGTSAPQLEAGSIAGRPGLTVRGLAAEPPLRPVTAGQTVTMFVDARGRPFRWRVRRIGETGVRARGTGAARDVSISFKAPDGPSGVYLLELTSDRWHTKVPFLVQAQKRSSILVVVPTITWLGSDQIDDPPFDGLPNSLIDGEPVHWPRVFAGEQEGAQAGLPAGFAEDVAPLLVFLDRRRIRYDLTSDLDLDLSRNPRATDRKAVLFAGSERWITRSVAVRLRRYVLDGGNVAYFGGESMRRGVTLTALDGQDAGTLSRPTEPTATDPFGARPGRIRTTSAPATLSLVSGGDAAASYGLMTGAVDLPGFTKLEESAPVSGDHAKLLAGVGEPLTAAEQAASQQSGDAPRDVRPALTAVQLGKGVVIRVGLPEWSQRLGDPHVAQVTRNIIDLLRDITPQIRGGADG